jgi:hypothetical protein
MCSSLTGLSTQIQTDAGDREMERCKKALTIGLLVFGMAIELTAQAAQVNGTVKDKGGAVLPAWPSQSLRPKLATSARRLRTLPACSPFQTWPPARTNSKPRLVASAVRLAMLPGAKPFWIIALERSQESAIAGQLRPEGRPSGRVA